MDSKLNLRRSAQCILISSKHLYFETLLKDERNMGAGGTFSKMLSMKHRIWR